MPQLDSHANCSLNGGVVFFCSSSWFCVKYSEPLLFYQTLGVTSCLMAWVPLHLALLPFPVPFRRLGPVPRGWESKCMFPLLSCLDLCEKLYLKIPQHDRLLMLCNETIESHIPHFLVNIIKTTLMRMAKLPHLVHKPHRFFLLISWVNLIMG